MNAIARDKDASIDVLEVAVRAGLVEAEPPSLRDLPQTVKFAQRLADATGRRNPEHPWLLARALRADGQSDAAADAARQGLTLFPGGSKDKPSQLQRLLVMAEFR